MVIIQILLILFFIFAIYSVIQRKKRGELSGVYSSFWILLWIAAGVVVISPDTTFYLARFLGIGRGADLIIYLSLTFLFFVFFQLSIKIEKLNREITRLTRELSLKEKDRL